MTSKLLQIYFLNPKNSERFVRPGLPNARNYVYTEIHRPIKPGIMYASYPEIHWPETKTLSVYQNIHLALKELRQLEKAMHLH